MTLLDYIEQFLDMLLSQKGFSANTLSAYRNDLTQFANFVMEGQGALAKPLGSWPQVTRDSVISFLLYFKERRYAPTTVARKQAAIKSFFKYLVSKGVVSANPTEELVSQHVDRALPHTISSSEADRLIEKLNAASDTPETLRDRAMLQLLYATGLRVGEMVALNLGDLDPDLKSISISSRGRSRRVPINSQIVRDMLREYLKRGRPRLAQPAHKGATLADDAGGEKPLFLNHRGQRLTRQGFWLILKGYARAAGLNEITPHTLRHSFAAQKLKNGADMRDLQQMLGHANVSTTQVYARIGQQEEKDRRPGRGGRRRSRGNPTP